MQTYLFFRKDDIVGTKIMEIDKKEALCILRENRSSNCQLGMLTGKDLDVIAKVYAEYAPFYLVESVSELNL